MFNSKDSLFITRTEALLGINYDEQQREIIQSFNYGDNLLITANAGSGKTTTLIPLLLKLVTIHKVKASKIWALSYTKEATKNIAMKYNIASQHMRLADKIDFGNFHKLCYKIIEKYCIKPEFMRIGTPSAIAHQNMYLEMANMLNLQYDKYTLMRIYSTIMKLNQQFIFDKDRLRDSYEFKKLREIPIDVLTKLRKIYIQVSLSSEKFYLEDVPLIAHYILEISDNTYQQFVGMYEYAVVDEFQDFSPLFIHIISKVTKRIICIGDLRQQIYSFQGASPTIVSQLKQIYPDLKQMSITKTYRCPQKICVFADSVSSANSEYANKMVTDKDGGRLYMRQANPYQVNEVISQLIAKEPNKSHMILTRNNIALLSVIDYLYTNSLPIYCTSYKKVYEIPLIKRLHDIIMLAVDYRNPFQQEQRLKRCLAGSKLVKNNLKALVEKLNYYDWDYSLISDSNESPEWNDLKKVLVQIQNESDILSYLDLLNIAYSYYNSNLSNIYFTELQDSSEEYYINIANVICKGYTLKELINREEDKANYILSYTTIGKGIKCMTIHTAKGLEADNVILLEANDTVMPKKKLLNDLYRRQCMEELEIELFNEVNLCYVAITRAINTLIILYSTNPSLLLTNPEAYENLRSRDIHYNHAFDSTAFLKFISEE